MYVVLICTYKYDFNNKGETNSRQKLYKKSIIITAKIKNFSFVWMAAAITRKEIVLGE